MEDPKVGAAQLLDELFSGRCAHVVVMIAMAMMRMMMLMMLMVVVVVMDLVLVLVFLSCMRMFHGCHTHGVRAMMLIPS